MKQQDCIVGCFGLQKDSQNVLNGAKYELPLKKIHTFVQIINGVAEVQMHQTFINNSELFLEVEYKFPIMPNACLYKFVATFGKTRMEGVVKQKQAAKIEYIEAVNAGKKAALGSIDPLSKDIFILKIGNIGPAEEVKIQLCYTEELLMSLNTFYQFNFASKLLPRYMNSIPQQDCLNAFRNNTKTVGGEFQWDFQLKLRSSRKITLYKSSTHQLILQKNNDQNTELELTLAKGESLSKDIILLYTFEGFQIPSYTLGRTDLSSSVLVSFIPKFCSLDLKDAELAAIKSQDFETDMDAVRGQYVFLLDRSYSMEGTPIQKAKQALIIFLKSLPIDTYFQVVSFGSNTSRLFTSSRKNSNENIDQSIKAIQNMSANMGGTEIYKPLDDIFKSQLIEGYPKQIFLLTDGGVSDTNQVIDLVRKNTKYSRTHTIGFGDCVSQALIIGCAQKGKGRHIFISDGQDPSQKIIQLLNDSLTPVISKVSLSYDPDVVESIVPNPNTIPYILKGEIVNFYLTFRGQLAHPTAISLSYVDSLNGLPFKSQLEVLPDSPCQAFVDKLGNYRRIKTFEEAEEKKSTTLDFVHFAKITDWKQKIIELSTKHQILSKHTSFLCVEKELVDGRFEQVNAKGQQRIEIVETAPKIKKPDIVETIPKINKTFNNLFGIDSSVKTSIQPSPILPPPLPQNPLSLPLPPPPPLQSPPPLQAPPPPMPQMQRMPQMMNKPKAHFQNLFGVTPNPPGSNLKKNIQPSQDLQKKKQVFNNLFGLSGGGSSSKPQQKVVQPPPPPTLLGATLDTQTSSSSDPFALPPPPPPSSISIPPPPPLSSMSASQLTSLFSAPSQRLRSTGPPPLNSSPSPLMQDLQSRLKMRNKGRQVSSDEDKPQQKMKGFKKGLFDDNQEQPIFSSKMNIKKKNLFEDDDQEEQTSVPKKIETQVSIKLVVSLQQFEGKWSKLDLVEKLFNTTLANQLANIADRDVAITLLVAAWIQKHHKEKVYSLILKKAMNWLKKQEKYQEYLQEYQQYIQ